MGEHMASDAEIAEMVKRLSRCGSTFCDRATTHVELVAGHAIGFCTSHSSPSALRIRSEPRKKATMYDFRAAGVSFLCLQCRFAFYIDSYNPVCLSNGHDIRWVADE